MAVAYSTKQIKEKLISTDHVLTVEGYIRLQTVLHIPQRIVDVALFMYARPNIVNLKFENEMGYRHIMFCPITEQITWDSIQMKIRTHHGENDMEFYPFVSSLKSDDQTCTICNVMESSLLNEKEVFEVTMIDAKDDPFVYLNNIGSLLFKDVAFLMSTLPPASMKHIWDHGVHHKIDGKKRILEETADEGHVRRLVCDCVIVFVKYLDRQRRPMSTRQVLPFVEGVTSYIYDKYHPLRRDGFENEKTFSKMLTDYVDNQLGTHRQIDTKLDKLYDFTAAELGNFVLKKVDPGNETLNHMWTLIDKNESDQICAHQVLAVLQDISILYVSLRSKTDADIVNKLRITQQVKPIAEWIVSNKMNSKRVVSKEEVREVFGNWLLEYE
eukprot:538927_1